MITHVLKQQCILIILYLFIFSTTSYSQNVEPWLGTGDLFNVKINMTINDVILELGEPLFLETISDEDEDLITSKLYYNFRTKEYSHKKMPHFQDAKEMCDRLEQDPEQDLNALLDYATGEYIDTLESTGALDEEDLQILETQYI